MNKDLYSYTQDYINRWVVSYADFVTMLLALFMVMYALSQIDINNLKEFSNSVGTVFELSKSTKNTDMTQKNNLLQYKRKLLKTFSTTNVQVKVSNINLDRKTENNTLKSELQNIETTINKDSVEFQNIEQLIQNKLGNSKEIYTKKEARGLVVTLKDTILFDPGSDIIKDKARVTLDKLAVVLGGISNPIRVEGHTDSKPINTRKFPSNWELSTARATNIIKYLVINKKLDPRRLSVVGYGEYMPMENNSSKNNEALNRRVDIVILSSASKIFEPKSKELER
jgi:chemotaxis protein MotB